MQNYSMKMVSAQLGKRSWRKKIDTKRKKEEWNPDWKGIAEVCDSVKRQSISRGDALSIPEVVKLWKYFGNRLADREVWAEPSATYEAAHQAAVPEGLHLSPLQRVGAVGSFLEPRFSKSCADVKEQEVPGRGQSPLERKIHQLPLGRLHSWSNTE